MKVRAGWLVCAGSFLLALWLRLKLLNSPPYGDEPMHYWMARHLQEMPTTITDYAGKAWFHPVWIVWQRPGYYLTMHPFAEHGFTTFRIAHAVMCSLLPVAACALLRAYNSSRVASAAGAFFAATLPMLVTWGGLGLMDEPMTAFFALGLAAHARGKHILAAVTLVYSVWLKETAVFGVLALVAIEAVKALRAGDIKLYPLSLTGKMTVYVAAIPIALAPILVSMVTGLSTPGAEAHGYTSDLIDGVFVSPWLLLVLLPGLAMRQTRALCGWAIGIGAGMVALHGVLHRAVEAWYQVWPVFVAGVAAIAVCDELWKRGRDSSWGIRMSATGASTLVAAIVLVTVFAPAGAGKGQLTRPLTHEAPASLPSTIDYELYIRGKSLEAAIAALGDVHNASVITVDLFYPLNLVPLGETAAHVYPDSAAFREQFAFSMTPFIHVAEQPGTMVLAEKSDFAFWHALNDAYADCRVLDNGEFRVFATYQCPGRRDRLEQAYEIRVPQLL